MSTPNLLYSDVEDDLRASVRGLLTDRGGPPAVLTRVESAEPYDLKLWRTLSAELGVAGLHVPENLGGQGASARETALVMEELGRGLAPVPFLGSAVLATSALLGADTSAEPVAALLRGLASGEAIGTLLVPLSTGVGSGFTPSVRVEENVLTGTVRTVADATVADVFVVPATGPDGTGLYEVSATGPGVTVAEVVPLDLTRRIADVTLDAATATLLVGPADAQGALDRALLTGAGLLASEQLGVAQWCLDETVAYVKQRYQFGRPVGSFQALKHRLADVWLALVAARAAARYAADRLASENETDTETGIAVALAQSYCADVAVHAAEECVQLHGGIGMTWEHPAHLYLKRAKADQLALGTPGTHRGNLAGLIDLPG
ncbi:acyl-CoA dehydrogenase [Prauserella marina]|uniref:Acyl-CoA dehydrogenase n=1 Tax=Prauserella marina TaxID=530584 RepID=A0A222VSD3_9PSEU|nr:acyl-CoA dehydrogenase family protein [Prauserella marina]ASR36800.1 acyl-CoA dehydrogenase [Prauserella marina]PWV80296.1 alkylation response protein AidB-like acyl-CoA dehydrogenase [Prauserella marina]SDD51222.1 Acyl-CoA dehydrogenase [Prauserella marina]